MLTLLIYLTIGVVLILIGPLAQKIKAVIIRLELDSKIRKSWRKEIITNWKIITFIAILKILGILFYPLLYILLIQDYFFKRKQNQKVQGAKYNENYLHFTQIGGAGNLSCLECDFEKEIVSFLHGFEVNSISSTGYQCEKCGDLKAIEGVYSNLINTKTICKCGGELSRDNPIFCPVCKGKKLKYTMRYIT